jgi:hypothetical protein
LKTSYLTILLLKYNFTKKSLQKITIIRFLKYNKKNVFIYYSTYTFIILCIGKLTNAWGLGGLVKAHSRLG